ncbi:3-deoxy-D-manno-octulosonic acid transferase [Brumicola nitratireducens]|uniref:3-deoxy-D-manno-octulosonic acid transferase n=1 Tax=Glaciecola nitratireducens (strain JCM 12485 / KCTC 12276 / FR1064) TaxID=1085623 RepID=G4QJD0_GLANF|nr:3-deoxy-D-manno-octulosonic acid transferase [Glaciecola nitratireducens]AEP28536.1 3-deoxy-D-manno-octulosonic-acid transferase [Glaciecola nitratireducens FR1064]
MNTPYTHRWYHFIWRWCYNLVLVLLLPLGVLTLLLKSDKTKGQRNRNRERFGFIGKLESQGILVHCVSVGEVNAAKSIVLRLQQRYPNLPITISTTSSTGAKQAREVFADSVQYVYLPIDIPICMWMFFQKLKPKLVLVTEVEIWPNMLHQCFKRNIPAVLINARMTNESLKNYQRLAYLFRPSLRKFSRICTQGQQDFDNFLKLGVYKPNLTLSNNMKFDLELDSTDDVKASILKKQLCLTTQAVFVAGSTHDLEETVCLDAFKKLRTTHPALMLIIVPRHPHRFEKVAQLCQATGYTVVKLSNLPESPPTSTPDILLVDAMGMLKACFQLASCAFVGGSFSPKGGHNALEPALYGVPTMMGPSIFNNPVICDALVAAGGLKILSTPEQLAETALEWLDDVDAATRAGEANKRVIEQNRGAIEQTLKAIEEVFQ